MPAAEACVKLAGPPTPITRTVGFLDDLKRQADEAKARQDTDLGQLERNAALTDAAGKAAAAYFSTLMVQLNVLRPQSKATYRLDKRHAFPNLPMTDFRTDMRRKRLRGKDVFDHTSLRWRLASGTRLELVKDFSPDIAQLESRLRRGGVQFHADTVRDPDTNKLREMRYAFQADFESAIHIRAEHDTARLCFECINLDGFETVTIEFPAIEVGNGRMDELARWIMGEPSGFLKGGQALRRVEA